MAHKKAGGSTALGRDSHGQRLGVKLTGGAFAQAGSIIVRQRGTRVFPSTNVSKGSDDTLFALLPGRVQFFTRKRTRFDGKRTTAKFVKVVPETTTAKEPTL